ncbi:partial amino-acid N-acetyltransferase, partial [Anaerolineae bacterium]
MNIRPATQLDQPTITRIIHDAGINPMSLDWRRFLVAEDDTDPKGFAKPFGSIVGIGQVKPHGDGSRELASIAVIPSRHGQGIARAIIDELLARESGAVYLTCRDKLESFYTRFGFRKIAHNEMPPDLRRLMRLAGLFGALRGVKIIVMKRERSQGANDKLPMTNDQMPITNNQLLTRRTLLAVFAH